MPTRVPARKAARRRRVYERRLAEAAGSGSLRALGNVVIGWLLAEAYRSSDPTAELGRLADRARELNERSAT